MYKGLLKITVITLTLRKWTIIICAGWVIKLETKSKRSINPQKRTLILTILCYLVKYRYLKERPFTVSRLCYKVYREASLAPTLVAICGSWQILPYYVEDTKRNIDNTSLKCDTLISHSSSWKPSQKFDEIKLVPSYFSY